MPKILDFQSFGEELWRIANVFRDDTLKTTEYLEEFSYFFFLKLWDERESGEENELAEVSAGSYIPYLPREMRFYSWAENPDLFAQSEGFESLVAFVQNLFAGLAQIGDVIEARDRNADFSRRGPQDSKCVRVIPGQPYWRLPARKPAFADGVLPAEDVRLPITRDLQLFRKLFRNHSLRVRYDPTIRELCKRLLDLRIHETTGGKWDKLGRAYEFVVNKLGEQKQYGQYFTPRHIVDRMVQIIDPARGESIYDPAAGTCGFIVRAFEYVRDKIERQLRDGAERERAVRELKETHLFAVEKAPDVYKLGLMNMILHGDGSTHMEEADSLSSQAQQTHRDLYDVILANPPFGPTAQERTAHFEYHVKLYEALFTQHMLAALKPGGRAAFVIKEGMLFGSQRILRAICKRMVEHFQVLAVISLPNGVFNPYSGAKTSVLVIRRPKKKDEPRTERVWFYQVASDGRDLGATRRALADLDTDGDLEDMCARFPYRFAKGIPSLKPDATDAVGPRSWWTPVDIIRKDNYNLSASRYYPHEAPAEDHEPPEVLINRLLDLERDIQGDLEELQAMISVPKTAAALKGAFRFQGDSDEGLDQ
ncbi:MAG: class I SAM-dependent DNA methyltransferase [Acidobacteriota bacterium]